MSDDEEAKSLINVIASEPDESGTPSVRPGISVWSKRILWTAGIFFSMILTLVWSGRFSVVSDSQGTIPAEIDLSKAAPAARQAIQRARQAVLDEPDAADRWGQLGMILLSHEFDADAVPCFVEACRLDPAAFRWSYYLGLAATALDRSVAIAAFEQACRLRPQDALANARLGELLLAKGDLSGAGARLRIAVNNSPPGTPRPLQALARVRLQEGKITEALHYASAAVQHAPDSRMTLDVLAKALYRSGDNQAAAEILNRMQKLQDQPLPWDDPYAAQVLSTRTSETEAIDRAWDLAAGGDVEAAILLLRRERDKEPGNVQLALVLSDFEMRRGDDDAALKILSELQANDSNHAEIHFRIGVTRFLRNEDSMAIEAFQRTLKIAPDHSLARYNLGQCYMRQGDSVQAIAAFRKALLTSPENNLARINLAQLLLQNNQSDEAKRLLADVLRDSPKHEQALELLKNAE